MKKTISNIQFKAIQSIARACNPYISKMKAIDRKIALLQEENRGYEKEIELLESGIVSLLGVHVTDLMDVVVEPGIDSKGNPTKTTRYVPTRMMQFDENENCYLVEIPDVGMEQEAAPITEEMLN